MDDFLEKYESAATMGGDASYFLAVAFISWYRPGNNLMVNMYDATRLDDTNRRMFYTLLYCRESGAFDDEKLFQIERRLIEYWNIKTN